MLKTFKRDNHGILYKEKYIYNQRKVAKIEKENGQKRFSVYGKKHDRKQIETRNNR